MKGYWIVRVDISDPEAYKVYVAANAEAFRKFGAHFLVRSGPYETVEGGSCGRNVVIEFKDYATALDRVVDFLGRIMRWLMAAACLPLAFPNRSCPAIPARHRSFDPCPTCG